MSRFPEDDCDDKGDYGDDNVLNVGGVCILERMERAAMQSLNDSRVRHVYEQSMKVVTSEVGSVGI